MAQSVEPCNCNMNSCTPMLSTEDSCTHTGNTDLLDVQQAIDVDTVNDVQSGHSPSSSSSPRPQQLEFTVTLPRPPESLSRARHWLGARFATAGRSASTGAADQSSLRMLELPDFSAPLLGSWYKIKSRLVDVEQAADESSMPPVNQLSWSRRLFSETLLACLAFWFCGFCFGFAAIVVYSKCDSFYKL